MADEEVLDKVFWALSDATRRAVLQQLEQGPSTVTELAQPHGMSLPGFMKHLRVLEDAGLVAREKEGRAVRCELVAEPMEEAAVWLAQYRQFWDARLDALGRYLYHEEETNPWPKPPPPAATRSSKSAGTTRPRPKTSGGPGPTRRR